MEGPEESSSKRFMKTLRALHQRPAAHRDLASVSGQASASLPLPPSRDLCKDRDWRPTQATGTHFKTNLREGSEDMGVEMHFKLKDKECSRVMRGHVKVKHSPSIRAMRIIQGQG
jgi:hypothetical protein